jgi:hypothetical protein
LAFAALHRLLRPVHPLLDRLPRPQARALRVAFGEEEGAAVDPFLVALATLSTLTEAAEGSTVLCVIDDGTGSTRPPPTRCCSPPGACRPIGWR